MSRIGMIIPYQELYYEANNILEDVKDIEVKVGLLSNSINIAKELIKNGAEVLISRGGTTTYLKNEFNSIPIVNIEISSYDIAEAIIQAKRYGNNIALIIFKSMYYEERKLSFLFDCNINIYYIRDEEQANEVILQAIKEGCNIFLGGMIVSKLCNQLGIRNILITSGTNSILSAVRQAQQILETKDESIRNFNLFKEVIENTFIGIIAANESNIIKIANQRAIELLKKPVEQVFGNNIYNLLQLEDFIEDGSTAIDFNGENLVINKKSGHIQSIDIATIFTIEKSSDINEKGQNIRKLYVKKGYRAKFNFNDIKGKSSVIKETIGLSKRYASVDTTILIIGETGTGKEMFAQSIHNSSPRKFGPFIAVNCAALTESLLESELFGYVKGAFTGASSDGKEGIFEMANGGTIFLDEISEVSLTTQAKLLRVLQEREVMRIGDNNIIHIDVRIIAATNKDLRELVSEGKFRNDLYFRLNVLQINIPPLRKRKGDLKILINEFLHYFTISLNKEMPIIDNQCFEILDKYKWLGNIRELRNFVERLIITYDDKVIMPDMIYKIIDIETKQEEEYLNIEKVISVLENNNHNKTKTAKELGISRTKLWKMLKDNELESLG